MSHSRRIRREARRLGLGATGDYPDGRIHESDEGGLRMAVAADEKSGTVILSFGKPTAWVGLPPQQAIEFAELIRKHAESLMT